MTELLNRRRILKLAGATVLAGVFGPGLGVNNQLINQAEVVSADSSPSTVGGMYEKYGGKGVWGDVLSKKYIKDGKECLVTEKGIFEKNPDGSLSWANIYDQIAEKGISLDNPKDLVPDIKDWTSDQGKPWGGVVLSHLSVLNEDKDIREMYLSDPMRMEKFGLPMSRKDYGNLIVVRFQRSVLQQWKDKTPWTDRPGQVVSTRSGVDAINYGLVPTEALLNQVGVNNSSAVIQKSETIITPEKVGEFKNEVGWAVTAFPGTPKADMVKILVDLKNKGMNCVYVGHNNPGDANPNKLEPGLSFAVDYENELTMYTAVKDMVGAAKDIGMDVVLPVGYQIQMGKKWNDEHQGDLRKNPDGSNMNHWGSGETASPYSPQYKKDIEAYYRKINADLVVPNKNVKALNLGDEPMGGDFSKWAKEDFQRKYGMEFDRADPKLKGEFQSKVLADYATWSAKLWKEINPEVKVMFTFHIQRDTPFFPNFEEIFKNAPDNFVFSADTHLHDGLPTGGPITDQDKNLLCGMVRTLGWLSHTYNRPVMLWTAANEWGLNGKAGGVPEAKDNLRIVTDLFKQNGGHESMLMAWGVNIKTQEYRDTPGMINSISQEMAARRDTLSTPGNSVPETVLYIPSADLYRKFGTDNVGHIANQEYFGDLNNFNFVDQNIIYLTDGAAFEEAKRRGSRIVTIPLK